MNKPMLESKMKLFGDRQSDLAQFLGISLSRLNAKINGAMGAEFTKVEMERIKERYNLTDAEFMQIFFANLVSCEDTVEGGVDNE